jgi:hypothetical protein
MTQLHTTAGRKNTGNILKRPTVVIGGLALCSLMSIAALIAWLW